MTSLRSEDPGPPTPSGVVLLFMPLNDLLQPYHKFLPLSRRVELEATGLDSTFASLSSSESVSAIRRIKSRLIS
jgi:hypothetical protein